MTPPSSRAGEGTKVRSTTARDSESNSSAGAPPSGTQNASYDTPDTYANLDEIAAPSPVQNADEDWVSGFKSLEETRDSGALNRTSSRVSRRRSSSRLQPSRHSSHDLPENYANLDELATPSPVENPDEGPIYRHRFLEEARNEEQEYQRDQQMERVNPIVRGKDQEKGEKEKGQQISRLATQLYTISYLVLFSFLGTLARLGLQAITFYPGTPVVYSELWANFGGSLFMGFLSEDRMLFKQEWGTPTYDQEVQRARKQVQDEETGSDRTVDLQAAKKAHAATKKTIPLYIGLATGFCGCFTSFSSFIRDAFLAMSNALPTPLNHPADYESTSSTTSTVSRNGGYSFMALLAVLIITIALCISGLHIGAHIAIASEQFTPSLPFTFCRKILDRLTVFMAWGCWLGAIILAIFPPDRYSGGIEIWKGRAVFALVFAPLGCLGRFYVSLYLNGRIASFPLGTFVVNVIGTVILGMSWDLQRVPLGGIIGCQVLQGIEDGFCGCLTTVSTWVSELSTLRRWNAYRYGAVSVAVALSFMIVIMGSMQWTRGFSSLLCTH
jgi:CrcB protein